MTRLEKCYEEYPDGIVQRKSRLINRDIHILDCCPYYLDCGSDDLNEKTAILENDRFIGCNGTTCEECWNKEYSQ